MSDVELNDKGLRALIKAFKTIPVARVGILGSKNSRSGQVNSNATIGAIHEFGGAHTPQRSFLRAPIAENLHSYLDRAGAFDKNTIFNVVKTNSIRDWVLKIAATAEAVVADAFATGGFGKWKPSDMRRKKVHQTLVETQQLRNSITSEVK